MQRGRKVLPVIGALGLASVLIGSGLSGISRAGDTSEKQAEPVVQNTSPAATLPDAPDLSANSAAGKSAAGQKDKPASDKRAAKAKFLAVFLKLFDGYRGAAP